MKYQIAIVFVSCVGVVLGTGFRIQRNSDIEFEDFLRSSMTNYSNWVLENKLDPSAPLMEEHVLGSPEVGIVCLIRNHYMVGCSEAALLEQITAQSNFGLHSFGVQRTVEKSYQFKGDFHCAGNLIVSEETNQNENLQFSGQGIFEITTNQSFDSLSFTNVNITEDFKFDLTKSWISGYYNALFENTKLNGTWNDPLINDSYIHEVEEMFGHVYNSYFRAPGGGLLHPAIRLLEEYLRDQIKDVDLVDIVSPGYSTTTESSSVSSLISVAGFTLFTTGLTLIISYILYT